MTEKERMAVEEFRNQVARQTGGRYGRFSGLDEWTLLDCLKLAGFKLA